MTKEEALKTIFTMLTYASGVIDQGGSDEAKTTLNYLAKEADKAIAFLNGAESE